MSAKCLDNTIDISIVMPVLNGMPYFEEALRSALEQSQDKTEVIVVDAGSTDGTIELVTKCKERDKRITLLHSDMRSMGHQYNIGIDNARGKYLAFLESDDFYDPEMLNKLYEAAVKNNYPDAVKSDIVMFMGMDESEVALEYHVLPGSFNAPYYKEVSLDGMPWLIWRDVNMWNGIYRTDFIRNKGIRLNETRGAAFQDTGFIEQVHMMAKSEYFIRGAHYHYRRDNINASTFQNVTPFVMQELKYLVAFLFKHKEEREKYANLVFNRMFGYFSYIVGNEYLKESISDEFTQSIIDLRSKIRNLLEILSENQKTELLNDMNLYMFIEHQDMFVGWVKGLVEKRNYEVFKFGRFISYEKDVVIVGAGEAGQSTYALLKKNRYSGQVVFCDNNVKLHGTCSMGIPIESFEKVCRKHPNGIYIISTRKYLYAMSLQLMGQGIDRKQIICAPDVSPHSSMELNWNL